MTRVEDERLADRGAFYRQQGWRMTAGRKVCLTARTGGEITAGRRRGEFDRQQEEWKKR